jgi:hypothetical protein
MLGCHSQYRSAFLNFSPDFALLIDLTWGASLASLGTLSDDVLEIPLSGTLLSELLNLSTG